MRKRKRGRIIVPRNATPNQREMRVASILVETGHDVYFIPRRIIKTPDIWFMGREWEIKSPEGKTKRTIENCIRHALKQSCNIIIDLSVIGIEQEKAIREVRRQNKLAKGKHRIMIVTRAGGMVKLS